MLAPGLQVLAELVPPMQSPGLQLPAELLKASAGLVSLLKLMAAGPTAQP